MQDLKAPICPHCGSEMKKWQVPVASTWPNDFFYICFNDACPYYVKGWDRMWEQQATRASYRCRLDPDTGKFVPMPVWSADALKDGIIEE
jgi:hypothetical protein